MMRQRLLRWLLHYANADPPSSQRAEFYALKHRLLRRWAEFRGHDMQHIVKACWGDRRDEWGDWHGCGPKCRKCGGSGVFDERWVRLERWQWGRYVFHVPAGDTRVRPQSVQISGRIEHPNYGRASREAALWLYVLCGEWRLLWRSLHAGYCCGWYGWPLLNVQWVVTELTMRLSWRRCWCGRLYPTWGSGCQICGKCRRRDDGGPKREV